ncbi:unnamed protein product [Closterium sp. Naga37s-1]|nr:unnamed protein product [Closterium sp. Naga37s-1]
MVTFSSSIGLGLVGLVEPNRSTQHFADLATLDRRPCCLRPPPTPRPSLSPPPRPSPSLPPPVPSLTPPVPSLTPPVAFAYPARCLRFPRPLPSLPPPVAFASPARRLRFLRPSPSLPLPIARPVNLCSPTCRCVDVVLIPAADSSSSLHLIRPLFLSPSPMPTPLSRADALVFHPAAFSPLPIRSPIVPSIAAALILRRPLSPFSLSIFSRIISQSAHVATTILIHARILPACPLLPVPLSSYLFLFFLLPRQARLSSSLPPVLLSPLCPPLSPLSSSLPLCPPLPPLSSSLPPDLLSPPCF